MTGIPDPVDIFEIFFKLYKKCLNNILVIKKLEKFSFFLFMALKSYEAFFDHFLQEPCSRKIYFFDKKK